MTAHFTENSIIRKMRTSPEIQGRRKTFFEASEVGTYVCQFLDASRIPNVSLRGKGVMNNRISSLLMGELSAARIPTHFLRTLNMQEQLVRATEPLPFSVHIYNTVTHDLAHRFGLTYGAELPRPFMEFTVHHQKVQDEDPLLVEDSIFQRTIPHSSAPHHSPLSRDHILLFGWSHDLEMDDIQTLSMRTNDILTGFFSAKNLMLSQITLEFGRVYSGEFLEQSELALIDELSPETFVVRDKPSAHNPGELTTEYTGCMKKSQADLATITAHYRYLAQRFGIVQAMNHQKTNPPQER